VPYSLNHNTIKRVVLAGVLAGHIGNILAFCATYDVLIACSQLTNRYNITLVKWGKTRSNAYA